MLFYIYGPPASGKTYARQIVEIYINTIFNEKMDNIAPSFIDSNVDNLTYEMIDKKYSKNIRSLLIDNLENTIKYNLEQKKVIIDDIVKSSFDIYKVCRRKADALSELLPFFPRFLIKTYL